MEYEFYMLILGAVTSVAVGLIKVVYDSKLRREEDTRKNLEDRLILTESKSIELKDLRDDLKQELSKINLKLSDVSSWQTTFQLELVSVKKDIEMLSKDIAILQESRYITNYGKNILRPQDNSKRERERNKPR